MSLFRAPEVELLMWESGRPFAVKAAWGDIQSQSIADSVVLGMVLFEPQSSWEIDSLCCGSLSRTF